MGLEDRFAYRSFRPGQRELAQRVYEACKGGQTLVAEAMSGFGKTAAVLAGALSASEETGNRVVFTCRTKRQIHRVIEEISLLQKKHPLKAASMFSKFDYCLLKRTRPVPERSFGWYCSFNVSNNLCSYFLNVPLVGDDFDRAVSHVLSSTPAHTELLREAESIHVCPYEVARLAVVQAEVSVIPYHYVFDPAAMSIFFDRSSLELRKTILVVDEAHNLRDFFRGINSTVLTFDQLQGAVREAEALSMEGVALSLRDLERVLGQAMVERPGWLLPRSAVLERLRAERGTAWLQNLAFELNACSGAAWGSITYERRLPSFVLQVGRFLERLSSSERLLLVKWNNAFGLVDPNPVGGLPSYLKGFRSVVLMSGTVNPSSVFIRSLGLENEGVCTYEVSSEPLVEVRTAIDVGVSTRYKQRGPEMFSRISDRIAAVIEASSAGVGVFTPSYSMLEAIREMVSRRIVGRNVVSEAPGLSSQDAADIFDSFRTVRGSVLFAVQGGRFAEGEDFDEDSMEAVVVVGLALPPPSPMLYAEYACLKRGGESDAYLMLSRLPALRKAFQAAGRHIRRPGKKGFVLFMDERFGSQVARDLMPSWLRKDLVVGDWAPGPLGSLIQEFWSSPGSQPRPS
jgi:DNA excision repair protein ERCC-2